MLWTAYIMTHIPSRHLIKESLSVIYLRAVVVELVPEVALAACWHKTAPESIKQEYINFIR